MLSKRLADHLLTQVGQGKADIVKTGNYRGMPSSSVLEPMVYLYKKTSDKRYLDFSKYIVARWETADGPELINSRSCRYTCLGSFPSSLLMVVI